MARPRKNRGPREGTIYERKDGRWVAELTDPTTGRRRYLYGKTYAEAHDAMTAAKTDARGGVPLAGKRLRVRAFLLAWLEAREHKVRPRTAQSYRYLVEHHLAHECGDACPTGCKLAQDGIGTLVLSALQPGDVDRMLARKLATGLSARTVGYLLQLLRHALRDAARHGLVARNVADLVEGVKGATARSRVEPLSLEQTRKLLDAVRGSRADGFVFVAVHTGLRLGELLGLAWSDLDLDAGTLAVRRTLQRSSKDGWYCGLPKSEHGARTVALAPSVIAALRAHRARQSEERLAAGAYWQPWGLVFPTLLGTPQHGRAALTDFQDALAAASLPRKRVHDLRHGCATMLLATGTDLATVARQLGHADASFTLRTYVQPDAAQRRSAADRLAAALGN